jgi:S1-C subfamily serine protease
MTDDDRLDPAPAHSADPARSVDPAQAHPADPAEATDPAQAHSADLAQADPADPPPGPAPADRAASGSPARLDADRYQRPADVAGSFAPHDPLPPDPGPRREVPVGAEVFAAPAGRHASFDPEGPRLLPSARVSSAPSSPGLADAFGRPPGAEDGFDVAAGDRIDPSARIPESPWWKPDAAQDPWRDDQTSAWLGRPAVYVDQQPTAFAEDGPPEDEPDQDPDEDEPAAVTVVNGRIGPKLLVLALVAVLLAGGIGGGTGYWLTRATNNRLHDPDIKLATTATPLTRTPGSVADIAKRVSPAVVQINVRGTTESGTGSGVVIDKGGYILTNNHVVSVAAGAGGSIRVVFSDETIETAKLVGRDPTTDLAVIKVTHSPLTVATLGTSSSVAVGDPVLAIGSPLGLQGTVTTGIVSALDRAVHVNGEGSDTNTVIDAIQTDAAINPGNSGGALVNAAGAVIGIPSAIASLGSSSGGQSGSIGLGFAIPIDEARSVATQLIRTGKAVHASIGLTARSVTDGTRLGAYVLQISPGGPAAKAGLKAADVVKLADGHIIQSADELTLAVGRHKPGDKISVRYVRGAAEHTVTVTLGADS